MNTRKMTLKEYNPELDSEAADLRERLPRMKAELRHDPEGCFGGRGNNFGHRMVEEAENRLNWLTNLGYTIRTRPYVAFLQAGVDLSPIDKIVTNSNRNPHKVFIGGAPGYRRMKEIGNEEVEANWVYDKEESRWVDQEPPQAVINAAEAVANYYNSTLLEWRGDFHCPRVYL